MRIRKRPIAVLSSSSWKTVGTPSRRDEEEKFLRPLVEAVMDVQARAETELSGDSAPQPAMGREISGIGTKIQRRPPHNWRNALMGCNAECKEAQLGGEGEKSNLRSNGVISKNRENKRRWSMASENDLCPGTVKKKGSNQYSTDMGHANDGREKALKRKKENEEEANMNNKNSWHGGSQCRRRNGRGWRCSQQTLVGYSLCEHHLGKGRFKSINASACSGPAKGSKFKQLHLIEPVSCKVELP